jgi:hypothetical protein
MEKASPVSFKLFINIFFLSVFLNTGVVSPHILTAREFSFADSLYIIGLTAILSAAIFAITIVVLYVFAMLLSKMKRRRAFWFLMLIGIATAVAADAFINFPLAKYNDQTGWIALIAAFSVMVSMSYEYQVFIGETESNTTIFH